MSLVTPLDQPREIADGRPPGTVSKIVCEAVIVEVAAKSVRADARRPQQLRSVQRVPGDHDDPGVNSRLRPARQMLQYGTADPITIVKEVATDGPRRSRTSRAAVKQDPRG
jgi:hypothetical protein